MIITCPHCQTKYQVAFDAIGSAGRKVQCAHCNRAWNQQAPAPEPELPPPSDTVASEADRLFDAIAEDAMDEALMAEAAAAAPPPAARPPDPEPPAAQPAKGESAPPPPPQKVDAAEARKRQAAFSRRQNAMVSRLPMARLRRAGRVGGAVLLVGLLAGGYFGRVQIVDRYPDLAGLYEAVGLGVNVVGLDFSNLQTLRALSGGKDILTVSAQIVGLSSQPVRVPPVVVSLLDGNGRAVYEWSVTPQVADLMAGERATFDTRLSLPPSQAQTVRLRFAGGGDEDSPDAAAAAATPAATEPPAEAEHAAEPAQPAAEHGAEPAPAAATHH